MMKRITKKWLDYAKADLEAAEVLLKSAKSNWSYQLCILHCHQAIEKILKTIIVDKRSEPVRTHNLIFHLEKIKLEVPKETKKYIEELNPYYQPSRYPDIPYRGPILRFNKEVAHHHFNKTKEIFLWLEKKLKSKK